jgi:hypothetical protein
MLLIFVGTLIPSEAMWWGRWWGRSGDLQAYTAATLLGPSTMPRDGGASCWLYPRRIWVSNCGGRETRWSGKEQFRILHQHWPTVEHKPCHSRQLLRQACQFSTKNAARWAAPVFARCTNSVDVEIQQRAAEYSAMREAFSPRLSRICFA